MLREAGREGDEFAPLPPVLVLSPVTGKMQHFEVMRYRNGAGEKILWIDGTWLDEGSPWANFDVEEILFNVDVETSMELRGL